MCVKEVHHEVMHLHGIPLAYADNIFIILFV